MSLTPVVTAAHTNYIHFSLSLLVMTLIIKTLLLHVIAVTRLYTSAMAVKWFVTSWITVTKLNELYFLLITVRLQFSSVIGYKMHCMEIQYMLAL